MKSIYHILDKIPAIYHDEIHGEYEALAVELVDSGRLRIDTDYYCNFAKYYDPGQGINIMLSIEELENEGLLDLTKKSIQDAYGASSRSISSKKINTIITDLKKQIHKLLPPPPELKLQLARIFVQSAHPIVIRWLLLDRVQVFITYSNSIGDVMNIVDWKRSGGNSGMQSTDGVNAYIYVSCGGDPFLENYQPDPTIGPGWAALARMQIIAGQEIGHYADIKRDNQGNQITRHAANFACTKPVPHVKQARHNDLNRCDELKKKLNEAGINTLASYERELRFYDKQKIFNLKVIVLRINIFIQRLVILNYARTHKKVFIYKFKRDRYMGLMILAMIEDMKANLSPKADVYKRANPDAEEAIACVEALARVPQQVMKWGYLTTRATMHDLYHVYYSEVIPSLIENYEAYTGRNFHRNMKVSKPNIFIRILRKLGLIDKDRIKFVEVRRPD